MALTHYYLRNKVITYTFDLNKTPIIMKTQTIRKITQFLSILMITALFSSPLQAQDNNTSTKTAADQEFSVKGKVSDEKGVLPGVNIMLKGAKVGAVTDENGEFTFPKLLSAGDILVFSSLGYEKQQIKIDANTTYINLMMSDDLIEIMGAPNAEKPYKSKRSK
ncbi:carboxypeptidase-like regulatory domain-containing protein [Psychroserpens sp. Hel_I_66]|uniref:carboxypeptidase-like regulatory domain-containing protein n=1 Tax=Psychroserpens sp. Hel_I_66 TaxID=1250004 RepID=UPI0006473047|nr:carboxypeptidase-like regulatory domain-containing protein [Psychroserpens sp. Hel_I_66]